MLEQIPMNDRYKLWVDECSRMFGGLDMLTVEAIQGKDGQEYIIAVNDSAMTLLGETQEEDRKHIADLCLAKMQATLKPINTSIKSSNTSSVIHYTMNGNGTNLGNVGLGAQQPTQQPSPAAKGPPHAPQGPPHAPQGPPHAPPQATSAAQPAAPPQQNRPPVPGQQRPDPRGQPEGRQLPLDPRMINGQHPVQQQPHPQQRPPGQEGPRGPPPPHNMVHRNPPPKPGEGPPPRQMSRGQSKDEEDTMRNLRKTFAGIFGDM